MSAQALREAVTEACVAVAISEPAKAVARKTARLHLASVARIRPPGERLDVQAERKRIAQTTAALAAECEMPNPLRHG